MPKVAHVLALRKGTDMPSPQMGLDGFSLPFSKPRTKLPSADRALEPLLLLAIP